MRNHGDDRAVNIGLLQRYAVDEALEQETTFFTRAEPSGRTVGVVGAGPAGLACSMFIVCVLCPPLGRYHPPR